jgi:hypothetical protein
VASCYTRPVRERTNDFRTLQIFILYYKAQTLHYQVNSSIKCSLTNLFAKSAHTDFSDNELSTRNSEISLLYMYIRQTYFENL